MLGNAAAALQGAPVTTLDFDFFYRRTPTNIRKLKELTLALGGTLLTPYYPVSTMLRLEVDVPPLQVDFLSTASAVRSLESLRSRSVEFVIGSYTLHLASLEDIIKSKAAAGREKDLASLPVLRRTLRELHQHGRENQKTSKSKRRASSAASRKRNS